MARSIYNDLEEQLADPAMYLFVLLLSDPERSTTVCGLPCFRIVDRTNRIKTSFIGFQCLLCT